MLDSPDLIPNKTQEQLAIERIFAGIPEDRKSFVSSMIWFVDQQQEQLTEGRLVLSLIKTIYVGAEKVKKRLLSAFGVETPPLLTASELHLDVGPIPPDKFRYQSKELIIRRPKVWKLIAELWTSKEWRIAMSDFPAIPVWGDHAMEVNETFLVQSVEMPIKFFEENDIQLSIKTLNRYCVMEPARPCSRRSE